MGRREGRKITRKMKMRMSKLCETEAKTEAKTEERQKADPTKISKARVVATGKIAGGVSETRVAFEEMGEDGKAAVRHVFRDVRRAEEVANL